MFTAPLGIFSKLVLSPIANDCIYDVKERAQIELCALMAIRFLIVNNCTSWRGIFEGIPQDKVRHTKLKISASPFQDLLIYTTFRQTHLERQ
jgi:hypothetical protein